LSGRRGWRYCTDERSGIIAYDYIPQNDGAFDAWFEVLNRYVGEKCGGGTPRWTHIPEEARGRLIDLYGAWRAAYERTIGPHTKVDTGAKNDAKKAARAAVRPFVNQYLRFLPVTNEDRLAMGIHNRNPRSAPAQPPETGPAYAIIQMGPGALGIVYRDGETGRKGSKPRGAAGVRIYYGVFDAPPEDQDALSASVWATRCPRIIRFREADRGKRAYFALKWEIRRENGESCWSEIRSEIIP
jgi:hypothetical protein